MKEMFIRIRRLLILVRRDYGVKFAGAGFGLIWAFVQYLFQVAIFYVVFGIFLSPGSEIERPGLSQMRGSGVSTSMSPGSYPGDFLLYLVAGMMIWLPIQEMLLRSCDILSENRALVRRTRLGMSAFLKIPVLQAMIQYTIISIPTLLLLIFRGSISFTFFAGYLWGIGVIGFLSGWAFLFSKMSVMVRDLKPILAILLQIAFWTTPVVYVLPERMSGLIGIHPVYGAIEIQRRLIMGVPVMEIPTGGEPMIPIWAGFSVFVLLSSVLFFLSRFHMDEVVVDQL